MKYFWILILFFMGSILLAQKKDLLELNELATPAIPAFTVLGLSPTDVNRPTLTKPFLMSLANGLNAKSIASDIAIETTPFWWTPKHGLTYNEYFGLEGSSSLFDRIGRSFAISLATSDASPDIDSIDSRNIAFGAHFQVLSGKPSREFRQAREVTIKYNLLLRDALDDIRYNRIDHIHTIEELENIVPLVLDTIVRKNPGYTGMDQDEKTEVKTNANQYIQNKIKVDLPHYLEDAGKSTIQKDSLKAFLTHQVNILSDQAHEVLVKMDGMSRIGWLWEFAGAASLLAPTNQIDYTLGQNWAGWTTLTYRLDAAEGSSKTNDFNLMGRLGGDFMNTDSYNLDFGLSWVLISENYSLTLEGVFRNFRTYKSITATDGQVYRVSETNSTWRFAVAYQYKFSDFINISLAAGKDYENSRITAGGFFSLLNFNFVLPGKQTIVEKG